MLDPVCLLGQAGGPLDGLYVGGLLARAFAGGAGGLWRTGAGGCWKRVRLVKKTPPRQSACKYVCSGWVEHGTISEDGKGQPPPKRWRRLHVEIGDRPHKRCRTEAQGLRADKRFRDVDPDDRNAKRLESYSGEKEAEGLEGRFQSLGVG